MELIIENIHSYYKNCIGCKRHRRDIMISFMYENDTNPNAVHDLFLTQEQVINLMDSLKRSLEQNNADSNNSFKKQ